MNWLAPIKALFASPKVYANATRLDARSRDALLQSLTTLSVEERGWIALDEARNLFSKAPAEYAFGETDETGKQDLAIFAAQAGCNVEFMPSEGRVYLLLARR